MSNVLPWLVAAGAAGGLYWYVRRTDETAQLALKRAHRVSVDHAAEVREARFAATVATGKAISRAGANVAVPAAAAEAPASAPRVPGLNRGFDDLFALHGRGIPVPYLRALAHAESGLRSDDPLGLINVVRVARDDYNRRHDGARVAAEQMRDPAINVRVAADTLRQIIDSYERNHGDLPNLREDWRNPRFVELLTFGWNAGFSERAGVGRVLRHIKAQRTPGDRAAITLDTVFAAAQAAKAASHLFNPRKLRYSKGVAAAYFREVQRDARDRASEPAVV